MTKVYDTATDIITFARSSSGTALRRVGYGDELVTNGTFDANTTGWTESSTGTGSVSWNASGYLDLNSVDASNRGITSQSITTVIGKTYVASAELITSPASNLFRVGASVGNGAHVSTTLMQGANTFTFTATATTTFITAYGGVNAGTSSIDNISVKEVIFDRATDPLVLFNHPDDIPRIEYAADGSLKGLLIEEQRTNLFPSSNDFTTWAEQTTSGATTGLRYIQENAVIGPDGQTSAHKLVESTDFDQQRIYRSFNGMTANTDYTYSVFLKAGERTEAYVRTTNTVGMIVDLADGTFTTISGSNHNVQPVGNGWYRCSFTVNEPNTVVVPWVSVANGGVDRYTGDGTSGIYVYGAQLEQGSFATSYIPTSGSQKTRDPDIASIPVAAFGYNQTAGTVVVEASYNGFSPDGPTGYQRVWHLDQASGKYLALFSDDAKSVNYRDDEGNVSVTALTATEGVAFRAAVAFSDGDAAVSGNGGVASTASPVSTLDMPSNLSLGGVAGLRSLNGHIKSLQYFPRRLTDAQLQELTS